MAVFNPDISGEWAYFGNTQAVTLFRRLTQSAFDAGTAVANAFSPGETKDVSGGKGVMAKARNTWHLWQSQTGNPPPKVGDVIQDGDSVRWTIWNVEVQAWGQRFYVETLQER